MACNAHNHRSDCNCGWGGATYWGGYSTKTTARALAGRSILNTRGIWADSIAQCRNAVCPVCGQPVFFVQAENGGRIFFDELGPPWPKHPCTDHSVNYTSFDPLSGSLPIASDSNWHILSIISQKVENGVLEIYGYCASLGKHLLLAADVALNIKVIAPLLIYPLSKTGAYEASFAFNKIDSIKIDGTSMVLYPVAYASLDQWRKAWSGDIEAENNIGRSYSFRWDKAQDGSESHVDYAVASYWLSKAAAKGHRVALNDMGRLYDEGLGWSPSPDLAVKYYIKSALKLEPQAFIYLANLCRRQEGELNASSLADLLVRVADCLGDLGVEISLLRKQLIEGKFEEAKITAAKLHDTMGY